MITVHKTIQLLPGPNDIGPYNYTWNITEAAAGCVSLPANQVTGTISNPSTQLVEADFSFFNSTCLTDSTITLTVTYNGGECVTVLPVTFTDPCSSFSLSEITYVSPNTLSVVASGGNPGYNYTWSVDPDIFEITGNSNAGTININYIGTGNPPEQTSVQVVVSDSNGCSATASRNIALCSPTVPNKSVFMTCNPDSSGNSHNANVCIKPEPCPNSSIDWSTFTAIPSNPAISVNLYSPIQSLPCGQGARRLLIFTTSPLPEGIYTIDYHVSDVNGIQSNTGSILVSIPACTEGTSPIMIAEAPTFTVECSAEIGDIHYIDVENYVTSNADIDWSSLLFIDSGTPTAGPLTTSGGATVTWNESTRQIEYEIPALTGTDSFTWTICDVNGFCAESAAYAIKLACDEPPVAVDDTECGVCNESTEHDIIANDTVNGQLIAVDIISTPANGVAVFNSNFSSPRILYTGNQNYTGSDSYTYRITNDAGLTDTATVTVNVICAGEDVQVAVCE
jgi:hypothetical protein